MAALERWRPLGLTATQMQEIKMSREEGPTRCEERSINYVAKTFRGCLSCLLVLRRTSPIL